MKKLVEWTTYTHMQLPDSDAIRQRNVGDQDLLPEEFARKLEGAGFVEIIGDATNVPVIQEV